eukprot:12105851-Alexandrium_andersonii.AAC.1
MPPAWRSARRGSASAASGHWRLLGRALQGGPLTGGPVGSRPGKGRLGRGHGGARSGARGWYPDCGRRHGASAGS